MKWYIIIFALVLAVILSISFIATSVKCWASWGGTDIDWRVSKFVCQVNHPKLGWIPENRFRGDM